MGVKCFILLAHPHNVFVKMTTPQSSPESVTSDGHLSQKSETPTEDYGGKVPGTNFQTSVPYEEMLCSSNIFGFDSKYTTHILMDGNTRRPMSTTLHCFHDAHPFSGAPVIDEYVYCSWSCRKAHLIETQSYHNTLALQGLPTKARKQSGILKEIKPSPPRMCLAIFGGPLSIEDFRAMSADESRSMDILPEYLITEKVVYELKQQQSDTETFRKVFQSQCRSSASADVRMDTAGCSSANSTLYYELDRSLKGTVSQTKVAPTTGGRGPLGALMTKKKTNT